jgi:replicative DNA helicase
VEQRPDKRPSQADLRDSGQLEQDADTIVFLLREEYYIRKEKAEGWEAALALVQNEIEFICAKRRNGVEGSAKGYFYGQYQAVRG